MALFSHQNELQTRRLFCLRKKVKVIQKNVAVRIHIKTKLKIFILKVLINIKINLKTPLFKTYNVINNSNKATDNVGIAIINPYLIKLTKLYLTSCLLTKSVNIIPANAPIGVKKAPIFEPMIVE